MSKTQEKSLFSIEPGQDWVYGIKNKSDEVVISCTVGTISITPSGIEVEVNNDGTFMKMELQLNGIKITTDEDCVISQGASDGRGFSIHPLGAEHIRKRWLERHGS